MTSSDSSSSSSSDAETDSSAAELAADDLVEIPQVAASEYDLLMMARALITGPSAQGDVWVLFASSRPMPPHIGPTCAELLEETLRQAWRALWMRRGAQPGASIRPGGEITRGRLWERHSPQPLAFTAATMVFLRWLVSTSCAAPPSTIAPLPAAPLALGDQLLVYLALDAARNTPAQRVLAAQPFVRGAPLAWLCFADLFAPAFATHGPSGVPAFDALTEGPGAIVVEALGGELARRWRTVELGKRSTTEPDALIALGAVQDHVLEAFMAACNARRRRDLAGFVVDASAPLLARDLAPQPLALDPTAPLSVRARARLATGSLARAIVRWCEWDVEHRGVRFIDDDYAAAQLLLERFEPIGAAGAARAAHWLGDLASLVPTPAGSDTVPVP